MNKPRKCRICKNNLHGRVDKVYCSAQCKNAYHKGLRRATTKAARRIDGILHRNRSILLEILGKNINNKRVVRRLLDQKRFNYKYCTHFHVNTRNKLIRYVYDFSWMDFSTDEVVIKRLSNKWPSCKWVDQNIVWAATRFPLKFSTPKKCST